ncbi:Uncharacterised protein [Candidatus Bilamarchaeum dharawalense]|uniref:Uncharacterized protein n=1 Tax=Candidatus Bilamarchaeum dharawalense TaxID=2885759 RepID=A0A5E4LNB5_9ARCH|nr:Uncharacterised protein [Candidatus Bilamarchaeum dharawalense]
MATNRRLVGGLVVAMGAAAIFGYQAHSAKGELERLKSAVASEAIRTAATAKVHDKLGETTLMLPRCSEGQDQIDTEMMSIPLVLEADGTIRSVPSLQDGVITIKVTTCVDDQGVAIAVTPVMMDVASNLARLSGKADAMSYVGQAKTESEGGFEGCEPPPEPDNCQPIPNKGNEIDRGTVMPKYTPPVKRDGEIQI